MKEPKAIKVNELLEMKGPIWVINTAHKKHRGGSEVHIVINNGDQATVLAVERSWLPVEVTKRYPRDIVVKNQAFLEAVANELIQVISEEDASMMLSLPQASKERARMDQIKEAVRAANASKGIGKNVMISTGDPDQDEAISAMDSKSNAFIEKKVSFDMTASEEEEETAEPMVAAQFQAWVISLNAMEDEDMVKSELRNYGDMSIDEATYLMKNIAHEGIAERIRKRLKSLDQNA